MAYIPPKRGEPVVQEDKSFTLRTQKCIEDLVSQANGNNSVYVVANDPIVPATKTKITYDSKGLVTSGENATTSDIAEGSNKYFTVARVEDVLTVNGYLNEVTIATANGFSGTSDGLAPEETITLGTSVNGLAYGDGTILAAATMGSGITFTSGTLSALTPNLSAIAPLTYTTGTISSLMNTGKLIGRASSGSGVFEELDLIGVITSTGNNTGTNIHHPVFDAGTTTAPAAQYEAGVLVTTPVAGYSEYDGLGFYLTKNTALGREVFQIANQFITTGNKAITGGAAATGVFGTNKDIPLLPSTYHEIEMEILYGTNNGTGTANAQFIFTFMNDSATAPGLWTVNWTGSPITGNTASPVAPAATQLGFNWTNVAASSLTVDNNLLTKNKGFTAKIYGILITPSGTNPKLTSTITISGTDGGNVFIGSWWSCRVIPPNTGNYV